LKTIQVEEILSQVPIQV